MYLKSRENNSAILKIKLGMLGNFACFCKFWKKIFQEYHQNTTRIQIRTDILSGLIWVLTKMLVLIWILTVCNGHQQILTHKASPIICSRLQFQILLLFSKTTKRHDISRELSAGRQFTWKIIPYFFSKIRKIMSQFVFSWSRNWRFKG